MKPNLPSLLFLLLCTFPLLSQSSRTVVRATLEEPQSTVYEIPLQEDGPFLSYFLEWEGTEQQSLIRFSADARSWTDWQVMSRDEHSPDLPLSSLGSTAIEIRYFQLGKQNATDAGGEIRCHFYNPGHTERKLSATDQAGAAGRSCSDLTPPYFLRSEWCPNGSCAEHPNPSFATITHLVIHHSAGTNQSNDWPAVVRSIWDFHVNGRGWSDIGYNWLIDPEGRIYHGRSNDAIGAHFCGSNTGTLGVCLLGDFTDKAPEPEAIAALKTLLSWKACEHGIDPLAELFHASSEKILPTVIGHRDGCATACPGNLFYPQLPEIRNTLNTEEPTAVKEPFAESPFQIYPNPARHSFRIMLREETFGKLQLTLYTPLGQLYYGPVPLERTGYLSLDERIPSGVYLLSLHSDNGLIGTRKISILD